MNKVPKDISKLKYEQAIMELESILERIESGEIGLEESLAESERAAALIQHCRSILDRVQSRVIELTENAGGQLAASGILEPTDEASDDVESKREDEETPS